MPTRPLIVLVHGTMDRSAGLLRLSRRPRPRLPGDALRPARLRAIGAASRSVRRRSAGQRPRRAARRTAGARVRSQLRRQRRARDRGRGTRSWSSPSPSTRRRCRGSTGGRARPPVPTAIATQGDPGRRRGAVRAPADQRRRWERLPPSTRAARRSEGPAMVGELVDLREHAPWRRATRVAVPVVAMYGERGAAHHRAGTEYLAPRTARLPRRRGRGGSSFRSEHARRGRCRGDRRAGFTNRSYAEATMSPAAIAAAAD